jgi:hypothetical protein
MLESAEEALAWALSSPVPADLEAALARIEDAARRMSLDADLDAEDKRVEGNSRDFHQGRESGLRRAVADIASALSPAPVGEKEDAQPYKDALHDLVMLKAQQDIGCVPAPTKEQWSKAWADAEELVRVEP